MPYREAATPSGKCSGLLVVSTVENLANDARDTDSERILQPRDPPHHDVRSRCSLGSSVCRLSYVVR